MIFNNHPVFPFRLNHAQNITAQWLNEPDAQHLSPAPLGFLDGQQTVQKRRLSVSVMVSAELVPELETFFEEIGCRAFWLPDIPRDFSIVSAQSVTVVSVQAGLDPGTRYYYRAYATDGTTTLLGSVLSAETQIGVTVGEYALVSDTAINFINTSIILNNEMDYEYKAYGKGSAYNYNELTFFGGGQNGWPSADGFVGFYRNDVSRTYVYWGPHSSDYGSILQLNAWIKFTKTGSVFAFEDETNNISFNVNYNGILPEITRHAYFFANNNAGIAVPNKGKGSYLKIWSDSSRSILILDMWAVPAGMYAAGASMPAPSNCMWDAVSQTYLQNMGSGSFGIEVIN